MKYKKYLVCVGGHCICRRFANTPPYLCESNLRAGVYLVQVLSQGELLGSGKVVVSE